eukprot:TRINITY_DN451_c0_g1_i2.p1 TRINITY_DN451_c0_g1~~TRINITY_DN451_c0_g1_i2.p1  ORF type:complete len:135 (-),score=10.53 TRINITY_DN451_c0_g1_i2:1714-2118(-)
MAVSGQVQNILGLKKDSENKNSSKRASVYSHLCGHHPKWEWWDLVWNRFMIPKYSFAAWMACNNRLAIKDRILKFGVQTDLLYVLCGSENESRNHILFECPPYALLFKKALTQFGFSPPISFMEGDPNMVKKEV